MNKRFAFLGGLLLFVLVLVALATWQISRTREPVYNGRKLSEWMHEHVASSAANPPYGSPGWKEADDAIRKVGTNGIPTLLRMIAVSDDDLSSHVARVARFFRLTKRPYRLAFKFNEEAEYAFEILGPNAASATPELIKIYQQAKSAHSQRCAALALGHIGQGAQDALPVLIRNFHHTNDQVRFYAVSAVMHIRGDPAVIVPALQSALKDAKAETRWNAIVGLSMYGRKAEAAVPHLLECRENAIAIGNHDLKQQADVALWRIAPEKTAKAMVVEQQTPIVVNGVTTERLDLVLRGDRRTLIKPGTTVPVARQTWDSDPRGRIQLYRGAKDQDGTEKEILLGDFEIIGLPSPPEKVHAYAIIGIADGNVFICAQDVINNESLEVRRIAPE